MLYKATFLFSIVSHEERRWQQVAAQRKGASPNAFFYELLPFLRGRSENFLLKTSQLGRMALTMSLPLF